MQKIIVESDFATKKDLENLPGDRYVASRCEV